MIIYSINVSLSEKRTIEFFMHNLSLVTFHSSAQDTLFIITFMIFPFFCYFNKGWCRSQMSKRRKWNLFDFS